MNVLVTGAAGFIGRALVGALAQRADVSRILAFDQADAAIAHPKVENLSGNLAYAPMARSLVDARIDAIFHLASLVSGGAEQNYELGMKVNFEATRDLLEAARLAGNAPRFVFTSSIAVYRADDAQIAAHERLHVTDDTRPAPRLSYGAQKLMCEVLINDMTRRGYVDGRSLRLPTVMVRGGSANTALSGWTSALAREPLAGRDYVCPVREATGMACISVGRVVAALLHAFDLPTPALGLDRTVLLTGIPVSGAEMWAAVQRQAAALAPARRLGRVRFEPDPAIQPVMDAVAQSTFSARAAALGFPHNASVDEIVAEYINENIATPD